MEYQPGTTLAPPSDGRIASFENAYRIKLPIDYIAELKRGNGGIPIRNRFFQGKQERLIERLLCLLDDPKSSGTTGWYDISVVFSQLDCRLLDDEDLVGSNVIPIAALFAGDFLCLDFRMDPHKPVVAVWDHELSTDFHPVLQMVAASFGEFAAMLRG